MNERKISFTIGVVIIPKCDGEEDHYGLTLDGKEVFGSECYETSNTALQSAEWIIRDAVKYAFEGN